MTKAKIIPFKVEHIETMEIRDYELQTTFQLANIQVGLKIFEERKTAGTIVCDGRVIAVMGFHELWPGVCELWVIPSKYLSEYALSFARTIRRAINTGILDNFHRVQIQAKDDELHNRWLKFLHFEKEGTLKKYDTLKNNYNIWARVKLCQQEH